MDMSTQGPIKTRREGAILEVTLDRPKANAIDLATSRLMGLTFRAFRDDDSLRVCILRAEGEKFFCPGWDLKAAAGGDAVDGDYGVGGFGGLQELPNLNKPVICALNGMAIGGGFEIAMACDLIIAADHVQFGLPEMPLGIVPDAGALQRLPRMIPRNIAMEMFLLGRRMGAAEAAHYGLVNKVVPREDLMSAARAWADQIAGSAPLAMQTVKEVERAIQALPLQAAFAHMRGGDLPTYRAMLKSDDAAEGIAAFAEKRDPVFKGN